MARLIGLVKPLTGFMLLAILMGLIGHLCAAFITIFGGYAVLEALRFDTPFPLTVLFVCVVVFAIMRGDVYKRQVYALLALAAAGMMGVTMVTRKRKSEES